jgi:RNA polymerase sigma-70 factor, ECF subfamily
MIDATLRGAWGQLEQKLRPFIASRVSCAADADDVLQDVFLRIQRALPDLRDEQRFGPWVYQVARSTIADFRRRRARHPLAPAPCADEATAALLEAEQSDDVDIAAALAQHLVPFVAALPSPYREALILTELEGLTQKEAADMLGISLPGMKSRVQRGRAQLRASLDACCRIALDVRGHVQSCEPRPDGVVPAGCCEQPCPSADELRGAVR